MASISRTYGASTANPVATGSTILAAHINTDLDAIYADYNGNITNANVSATAAITQGKLSFTSPTSIASTVWKGVTADPAIGNGSWAGSYQQIGKFVYFTLQMQAGTTTTFGTGAWYIDLPVAANKTGSCSALAFDDSAGNAYACVGRIESGDVLRIYLANPVGTAAGISTSGPFTWATSDFLYMSGVYEGV